VDLFFIIIILGLLGIILTLHQLNQLSISEPKDSDVKIVLRPKVLTLEPWRDSVFAAATTLISTEAVLVMADPAQIQKILVTQSDFCDDLGTSLVTHGVQQPLVVVLDSSGHLVLMDGYHRLVAAQRVRLHWLPVRVLPSERIRGYRCNPLTVISKLTKGESNGS
jgi:hypothetical protein